MNRILIVEDEARIAGFINKGLKKEGFQTTIASNGEEALQILEDDSFDLLLLDIQLPIKDGWSVLEELRAQKNLIPIIVVTACYDVEDKINKLPDQNIDYVCKPFQFAELLVQIKNILGLYCHT
ncbi:MAG: response regulator transcription factor [Richelia sp. RM2_1_2]|nr:response regulator transcription factor [Richelia sp. SM2_1_7]NJM22757.1 response regulator transcription factor [Richelia sp. SM1_7_0]NJN08197.1 response regulator transcription factor [Richelia sp. RM1_1_1]NJO30227.1 response regulator transcription factor [Richelia sp. SL_2_1]NJO60619.1 response regulator transcription factor [Richelia sp. RM2_1_2]